MLRLKNKTWKIGITVALLAASSFAELKLQSTSTALSRVYTSVPGADHSSNAADLPSLKEGKVEFFVGEGMGLSVSTPYFHFVSAKNTHFHNADSQKIYQVLPEMNPSLRKDEFGYFRSDYFLLGTGVALADWTGSESFDVSFGLDYLWTRAESKSYGIVTKQKELIGSAGIKLAEKQFRVSAPDDMSYVKLGMQQEKAVELGWGVDMSYYPDTESKGFDGGLQYTFFRMIPLRGQIQFQWDADNKTSERVLALGSGIRLRKAHAGDPKAMQNFLNGFDRGLNWLYGTAIEFDIIMDLYSEHSIGSFKIARYF